jgi:hypothetical protein
VSRKPQTDAEVLREKVKQDPTKSAASSYSKKGPDRNAGTLCYQEHVLASGIFITP